MSCALRVVALVACFVVLRPALAADKQQAIDKAIQRGVAYLRPKKTSAPQPPHQSIGPSAAFVPRNAQSDDLVAHVANASPAYEAGIRDGDVLLQVGQRDATKWRTDPEFPRFIFPTVPRGELTGTQLELTLKRGEQTFKATAAEQEIGIFAPTPETNSSK